MAHSDQQPIAAIAVKAAAKRMIGSAAAVYAHNDPVRLCEIVDRAPFLQEFRV